jgi:hypothetical protein
MHARELAEASEFGAVRLAMQAFASLGDAPGTWGEPPISGTDAVDAAGRLFGTEIGDALGTGLGPSGTGAGGGGTAGVLGLSDLSLGRIGGGCAGPGPCSGVGTGYGHPGPGYTPHFKGPRYARDVIASGGHLPPEVIQRIVRQNDGRFRACYERGLRSNPSLTGRVTVRFVIDRTGAVAVAADGGSDLPDDSVRQCVVTAFGALSFPAPEHGLLTVTYPIAFTPE